MNKLIFFSLLFIAKIGFGQNELPQLKINTIDASDNTVKINFDLTDPDNDSLEISIKLFSLETGTLYTEVLPVRTTGDIGFPVKPGLNKQVEIGLDPSNSIHHLNIQLMVADGEILTTESITDQVNQDSLKSYVQFLQGRRNSVDQTFYSSCRNYLYKKLGTYLNPKILEIQTPQYTCQNFEATKYGFDLPAEISIIDAHYDSFSNAPGADDNASGVAGVLEAARILAPYAGCKSLRFVLFDLEEAGLIGSILYTGTQVNRLDQIKNVINFEMIGYYTEQENTQDLPTGFNILFPDAYNKVIANNRKGDFITNVGNTNSTNLVNLFESKANQFVPQLKVISLLVPGNGAIAPDLRRSDHASFWDRGIPALMITDGANFRNKNYHTTRDSIQYLNFDFMSQVVKASLATLIETACLEHACLIDIPIKLNTSLNDISSYNIKLSYSGKKLMINSSKELPDSDILLHSVNGQKFTELRHLRIPKGNSEWSIPKLSPGIYLITINNGHSSYNSKLLVTHNE